MSQRIWRHLALVEPGELGPLLWSAAYFFFLLFSYYILRPLRDDIGAAGGLNKLPWLFTGTMLAMLAVNPLFALLVSRLPRRRFIPITYHFFAANIVLFFALMKFAPADWQPRIGQAFYIWTSVFNLFAITVFWGLMADIYRREQGARLFGFIAIGGTLGSIGGSAIVAAVSENKSVNHLNLMLLSVVFLELAVLCVSVLFYRFGMGRGDTTIAPTIPPAPGQTHSLGHSPRAQDTSEVGRGVFNGLVLLVRSPYLLGISLYILLYTMTSTYLYFEQAAIAKQHFSDPKLRLAFFSSIDLWTNILTLSVQLFATGQIVKRLGVAVTLAILPVLTAIGFTVLAANPTPAVFATVQVLRRGLHYAVDRPARETLYTVLGREEKYKSKSFIDTFVYRGGDQIAAWTRGPLANMGPGVMASAFIGLAVVWGATGIMLGRRQRAIARDQESASIG